MIYFIKSEKEKQILLMRIKDFLLHTQLKRLIQFIEKGIVQQLLAFPQGGNSQFAILRQIRKIFHNLKVLLRSSYS